MSNLNHLINTDPDSRAIYNLGKSDGRSESRQDLVDLLDEMIDKFGEMVRDQIHKDIGDTDALILGSFATGSKKALESFARRSGLND